MSACGKPPCCATPDTVIAVGDSFSANGLAYEEFLICVHLVVGCSLRIFLSIMHFFQSKAMKPSCVRLAAIGLLCAILVFFLSTSSVHHEIPSVQTSYAARDPIPNHVHYVQLMREPGLDIEFQFKNFLSVYAANLYFQPDAITLHTDASDEAITKAQFDGANIWTRLIFGMPKFSIHQVTAPKFASGSGVAIEQLEHKSDFVRMDAIFEHGGIYIDFDVHPLRDVRALREAGFANVLGREKHGLINNGFWMSKKKTGLVYLSITEANRVYDGGWNTHSCQALTKISERLVRIPNEVLIMDQAAFHVSSWEEEDYRILFEPHSGSPIPVDAATGANATAASVKSTQNPINWWNTQEREQEVEADWVRD